MNDRGRVFSFVTGVAAGAAGRSALKAKRVGLVRLAGSSIASPGASGWMTDFLNAAYYRREAADRAVDDLRFAFAVLTTFWHRRGGRPLRGREVVPFHHAFGRRRLQTAGSTRGTLSRAQLQDGANELLGGWFTAAYHDPTRRGWGIAFADPSERAGYEPEQRLRLARVGRLTPGHAPAERQTWHTYPPVRMPSGQAAIVALAATETWPDYASEIGRFTPLRSSDLLGQTFEIEVTAGASSGRPVFQRGYVTTTRLATREDPPALERYFGELNDGLARFGAGEPQAMPPGGRPLVGLDLTTHEGHFMGAGLNRLILYELDGEAWGRAAGTWDPMPWHLEQIYRVAGREAQHAFWGQGAIESQSMLHQLARRCAE